MLGMYVTDRTGMWGEEDGSMIVGPLSFEDAVQRQADSCMFVCPLARVTAFLGLRKGWASLEMLL